MRKSVKIRIEEDASAEELEITIRCGQTNESVIRILEMLRMTDKKLTGYREDRLESCDFFRASKSSIINFNRIQSLKPEFGGTMQVTMTNGERLNVSRQYAKQIKEKLGCL